MRTAVGELHVAVTNHILQKNVAAHFNSLNSPNRGDIDLFLMIFFTPLSNNVVPNFIELCCPKLSALEYLTYSTVPKVVGCSHE